jgi:ribokinase
MFDVISIGGVSRDVFFMTDEGKVINDLKHHQKLIAFGYGAKIIPKETEFTHGGGGANTAISFAKLGLHTAAILNVGVEGTGSLVIRELEEAGVSCQHMTRDRDHHTALSMVVSVEGGDHTMFLYRGSNNYIHVDDWREIHAKWFYVSSLTGESAELIPEIFSFARANNVNIAWNPGNEQLAGGYHDLARYLADTKILSLNKDEACSLLRSMDDKINFADNEEVLRKLGEMTPGMIIVTDGENGSHLLVENKYFHERAHSVEVIETTGAGDAYGSTFVSAIIKGYGPKHAMKMAAINSANVVRYLGAQKGLMTFSELSAKIDSGGLDA